MDSAGGKMKTGSSGGQFAQDDGAGEGDATSLVAAVMLARYLGGASAGAGGAKEREREREREKEREMLSLSLPCLSLSLSLSIFLFLSLALPISLFLCSICAIACVHACLNAYVISVCLHVYPCPRYT
jgi:hypothetical protein